MDFLRVDKEDWKAFFTLISRNTAGQKVELEVAALDIGDQIESDWVLVEGFSYDLRGDVIHVHTAALEHAIAKPRDIVIGQEGTHVRSIAVRDAEGRVQTIVFRAPLLLEAAPRSKAESGQEL